MQFDWSTFALQTVNFAVLVWLLHRFLYRPVLRMVDARRAAIDKQYADAQAAETNAEDRLAAIEAERAGIARERNALLTQTAAEAEQAAAARSAQAERDAASLIENAHRTIAAERQQALVEARHAALDLGADIASRLLAEIPISLRAEAWLDLIEQHLAAIPSPEKQSLIRQLANGVHLNVVTAAALPADAAALWHSRLERALGNEIVVDFGVDPKLVAGAELHFPKAILRFSWQDALMSMRANLQPDGDAR
jgi:F-type H+-transporting ATPase subunit b